MYIYCKKCEWSQDDFYNKDYNLLTKISFIIEWLIKPKRITLDEKIMKQALKNAKIIILFGFNHQKIFSWSWLLIELKLLLKSYFNMKWKTYEEFQNSDKKCPKCGKYLIID